MSEHKCFKRMNRELKKTNTVMVTSLLNPNELRVATMRIKKLRDGKRATSVIASFCPFCGKSLLTKKTRQDHTD